MQIGVLRIKALITALLDFVKADYEANVTGGTESESFLYRIMKENESEEFDFWQLSKTLVQRGDEDSRKLEVRIMFDHTRAVLPTIFVREPSTSKGKSDAIGYITDELYVNADGGIQDTRRRSFQSNFQLMITSGNQYETVAMKEIILALLVAAQDTFIGYDGQGNINNPFYNFNFQAGEQIANSQVIPEPIFIQTIDIMTDYEYKVPDLSENVLLNSILFQQNILSNG